MNFIETFYDELRKLALNKGEQVGAMPSNPLIRPPFKDESEGVVFPTPHQARKLTHWIVDQKPKKATIVKTAGENIVLDLLSRLMEITKTPSPKAQLEKETTKTSASQVYPDFTSEAFRAKQNKEMGKPKLPKGEAVCAPSAANSNPYGPTPKPASPQVPLTDRDVKTGAQVVQELAEKLGAFKSQAQRRKFYAMAASGEISQKTLGEWVDSTPKGKKLPERVKKPAKAKVAGVFDRLFKRPTEPAPGVAQAELVRHLETPPKKGDAAAAEEQGKKKGLFRKIMVFSDDIILGGMKLLKKDAPLPG